MPNYPKQSPEYMIVEISADESQLLKILRGISFGQVIVHKADGKIVRCEPKDSILINGKDTLEPIDVSSLSE